MKIVVPIVLACAVLFWMINISIKESANKVVRVPELVEDNQSRSRVRLGARLTSDEIIFKTEPERIVQFLVTDMKEPEKGKIKVEYKGVMPDTLREGRDVIMEGSFNPESGFAATTLSTQCPSKYQPPDPLNDTNKNNSKNY